MRKTWVAGVVMAVLASSNAVATSPKHGLTPADRCSRMAVQLEQTIKARSADKTVDAANTLHKQGNKFCLQKKWAQGLRAYATGLKMLGAKPADID